MKKFFTFCFILIATILITDYSVVAQTAFGCDGQYYVGHSTGFGDPNSGSQELDKLTFPGGIVSTNPVTLSPGSIGFNAMGLNPVDGFIYAIRYPTGGAKGRLIQIGKAPGVNEIDMGEIAALNDNDISYAGCIDRFGEYYFTSGDRLMKIISPITTTAVEVASSGFSSFADITIDPTTGQMYGSTNGSNNWLYTIDKVTGAVSGAPVGGDPLGGFFFAALFFDEAGNLFGYRSGGNFYSIDKSNGSIDQIGSGSAYSNADGCYCSFGRVSHTLAANLCIGLTPFDISIEVTNESPTEDRTGLTYTLAIPGNRFAFTETPAVIAQRLFDALLLPTNNSAQVAISNADAGINNKIVVNNFQVNSNSNANFDLELIVANLGGPYIPIPVQSEISGLPVLIGSTDLSDNPFTSAPDDSTALSFCVTLPVKLVSFSGNYKNKTASLNWVSENQINFSHYVLERSSDGTKFIHIANKQSKNGNSSRAYYQYTDDLSTVNEDVFFYRLKMINVDGSFKYSNVIVIRKSQKSVTGAIVSPNPVQIGTTATARFNADANTTIDLKIVDLTGRVLSNQQTKVFDGFNSVFINNTDKLQPGMYLLMINDRTTIHTTKFIITQ